MKTFSLYQLFVYLSAYIYWSPETIFLKLPTRVRSAFSFPGADSVESISEI